MDKHTSGDEPASMAARVAVQETVDKLFSYVRHASSDTLDAWEAWAVKTYGIRPRRSAEAGTPNTIVSPSGAAEKEPISGPNKEPLL